MGLQRDVERNSLQGDAVQIVSEANVPPITAREPNELHLRVWLSGRRVICSAKTARRSQASASNRAGGTAQSSSLNRPSL